MAMAFRRHDRGTSRPGTHAPPPAARRAPKRDIILALAALAVGSTILSAQDKAPVPLDISIRNIFGGAVSGAKVDIVHRQTAAEVSTVTSPDGRALVWVPPGIYRITVTREGYGPLVSHKFCVIPGQPAHFGAALGPERVPPAERPSLPDSSHAVIPPSVPSMQVMSAGEIREAMAFGRKARKLSAHPLTAGRGLVRSRIGHLFTPDLRVATMMQVADATNRPFVEPDIPRWLVERVAWVVATPTEHVDSSEDVVQRYDVAPSEVVIEPRGDRDPRRAIRPFWQARLDTPCDSEMFESILGRQFPVHGLIAAFPMDAIQPRHQIAVTYSTFAALPGSFRGVRIESQTRRMRITDQHVRTWR